MLSQQQQQQQQQEAECGASLAEEAFSSDASSSSSSSMQLPSLPSSSSSSSSSSPPSSLSALFSSSSSSDSTSLASDLVGHLRPFQSPLTFSSTSPRVVPLVYADYTASSRALSSVESYIRTSVLPWYGNTHTTTSLTGGQSTAFRGEARQLVAEGLGAHVKGKAARDVVLFTGNGATGAVELLLSATGLREAAKRAGRGGGGGGAAEGRPVVLVGPMEHHSNIIPWRESGCEVVEVPAASDGTGDVSLPALESLLASYSGRRHSVLIGAFSAASNVTGRVSNVVAITKTLHRHGALAFWDYAAAAPYLPVSFSGGADPTAALDAVFFSPHKMLGGVGGAGVLVVKKALLSNSLPVRTCAGGGTVFYVTSEDHRFLSSRVERYEGGTPNILGCMRTGLAFLVKQKMGGGKAIEQHEYATRKEVVAALKSRAPNLVLLGSKEEQATDDGHLPILSFLIRCGDRFLHYNFVCALLNDLFGIQSRGGCQCAGPYSQRLLGLTTAPSSGIGGGAVPSAVNRQVEAALLDKAELLRPGYSRLSLPYCMSPKCKEYILSALEFVATHGWRFLVYYRCSQRTGEWRHHTRVGRPLGKDRAWLSSYLALDDAAAAASAASAALDASSPESSWGGEGGSEEEAFRTALADATGLLAQLGKDSVAVKRAQAESGEDGLDAAYENLRWFVYPREVSKMILEASSEVERCPVSSIILGAIQPIDCDDSAKPAAEQQRQQPQMSNAAPAESNRPEELLFMFREDEGHEGHATRADIASGLDEGELTLRCVVHINGDWIAVRDFLSSADEATIEARQWSPEVRAPMMAPSIATSDKKPLRTREEWGADSGEEDVGDVETHVPHVPPVPPVPSAATAPAVKVAREVEDKKAEQQQQHRQQQLVDQQPVDEASAPASTSKAPSAKELKANAQPPKKLLKKISEAIMQWGMIKDGDRLLLGLSGGKDSLTLLHCLLHIQRIAPVKFEIACATVDPMTPSFDPSPLIPYIASLGLTYHYLKEPIVDRAYKSGKDGGVVSSLCAFCARMKRGLLYSCARQHGYTKLVLAQHLDDLAESFLMSVMHNGFLRTMKANYEVDEGGLRVIRPLAYCRETMMKEYAISAGLPVINENCPACFEEPKERARTKKLLSKEENLIPALYDNLRRAILPLMEEGMADICRTFAEETIERGRKKSSKKQDVNGEEGGNGSSDKTTGATEKPAPSASVSLAAASDYELLAEIARRKKAKASETAGGSGMRCNIDGTCEMFD